MWWVVPPGLYLLHVAMWPLRKCWACGGTGRLGAPIGRAYRDCDACGGRGERYRWGLFRRQ
jgi:hypothetical protein